MKLCLIDGCKFLVITRGYCNKHYMQQKRNGELKTNPYYKSTKYVDCSVIGCDRNYYSKGYCKLHYARYMRGVTLTGEKHYPNGRITKCKFDGCKNPKPFSKGYCKFHYHRLVNGIPLDRIGRLSGKDWHSYKNGNWKYKNYGELKRNKAIKIKQHPLCEYCNKNPAVMAIHRDKNPSNHKIENLIVVCHSCIRKYHSVHTTSKYIKKYGATAKDLAILNNVPIHTIYGWMKSGTPFKTNKK